MNIINFDQSHIEKAMEIARMNYDMERCHVPELPKYDVMPGLEHFAENQLGVAAFEGERMLGFLCAYRPREDAFGTTNVKGTFTPIHAHGVDPNITDSQYRKDISSRDRIYSLLYETAAAKWVKDGIRSHAIALYAHDQEAKNSFYYNGFGLRCIDAVRSLENIPDLAGIIGLSEELEYCEVAKEEWGKLLELHNELITHLGKSPTFMRFDPIDVKELYHRTSDDVRYFTVRNKNEYIAYLKIGSEGENFITDQNNMMNICGAYCRPKYRGSGIYHKLLTYLMTKLKQEGYQLLGVDCESFNPNARGFWLKYFTEYTHSVVRRIDDKAIIL